MTKRIEVTEYQCNPTTFDLEEFVTAQTIDGMGNILGLDEGRMLDEEIDRLRNLAIGEAMPLGEPEAGLTVVRLTDNQIKTLNIKMDGDLIEDVPLHEYLTDEESLTIDEMYALNTLEVGETFEMGVHFGFVTFTRMT